MLLARFDGRSSGESVLGREFVIHNLAVPVATTGSAQTSRPSSRAVLVSAVDLVWQRTNQPRPLGLRGIISWITRSPHGLQEVQPLVLSADRGS